MKHALAVKNFSVQFVEKLTIMDFTTMPKLVTRSGIGTIITTVPSLIAADALAFFLRMV